jgi:hypothetical protein
MQDVVLLVLVVMLYFLELLNVEEHVHLVSSGKHRIIPARLVWLPVGIVREIQPVIV